MVSGSDDETIRIWDAETGKPIFSKWLDDDTNLANEVRKESKSDPCAELESIQFSKKDCHPRTVYRKMLLRIHPDKHPSECKEIATKKSQALNKVCDTA